MKIGRSCTGGLFTALTLCILLAPASAQAQSQATLRWAEADKPGTAGNLIASPSEVSKIAIGPGGVFYALDSANAKVYRSLNAGIGWEDITTYLTTAGAVLPATSIAVASDNAAALAVVDSAVPQHVFFSKNGGVTWFDLRYTWGGVETIKSITVSPTRTEALLGRDIAVCTSDPATAAFGGIYITGDATTWVAVATAAGLGATYDYTSVACEPGWVSGRCVVAVGSGVAGTNLQVISTVSPVTPASVKLNLALSGAIFPTEITTPASATGIISSSLALPSNFDSSTSPPKIQAYIGFNSPVPATDPDVYRVDDTTGIPTVTRLNANSGAAINIASIAYYGTLASGKLLAGDVSPAIPTTVPVRWTADPFALSPTWHLASQPPTGPGNAQVSWSSDGTVAYCGTGQNPSVPLDESAFSRSLDSGDTWEQISLIDTSIALLDVAVAPSPQSLFLTTISAIGTGSVWRSAGEPLGRYWGRILTTDPVSKLILRLSPNYSTDYTLYLYAAELGGDNVIMMSHNRGNSWHQQSAPAVAPAVVIDMVVVDRDTVYAALSGGRVIKTVNDAWFWQDPVSTSLSNINMLSLTPGGTILVGGKNGEVAYSTDGGASFTQIINVGTGDVWVVAGTEYEENGIVYAGNVNKIYRKAISNNASWECIRTLGASQQVTGLAVADGILYGAWYDGVGSGVERCLEPTALVPEWDTMNIGAEAAKFDVTPYSFRVLNAATEVSLWAIHNDPVPVNQALMVYDDILAKVSPTLSVPDPVQSDLVSGRNNQFVITWPSVSTCTEYEVQIYADAGCTALALSAPTIAPAIAYHPPDVASPSWVVGFGLLACGQDYYVRLRVRNQISDDQIRGLWSVPVKFTVALDVPVRTAYSGPVLTAPDFGATSVPLIPSFSWGVISEATEYELILAKDANLTQAVANTPVRVTGTAWQSPSALDYDTTYFWRVRITAPVASEWSPVANFTTVAKPSSSPPPSSPPASEPLAPPYLLWLIISLSTVLIISLIVLTVRTRR